MKRRKLIRWIVYSGLAPVVAVVLVKPDLPFWIGIGWMKFRALFGATEVDLAPARERLGAILGAGVALPLPDARIVVRKAARKLDFYDGEKLMKTYRVALGGKPAGAKEKQGDRKTPTGDYFICARNGLTQYHLFLGLNYPNAADAARGLKSGLIDPAARDRIAGAESDRRQPPWDGPLGGATGIHGGTSLRDWTLGCVALDDADVEEVWLATREGTPVRIEE